MSARATTTCRTGKPDLAGFLIFLQNLLFAIKLLTKTVNPFPFDAERIAIFSRGDSEALEGTT